MRELASSYFQLKLGHGYNKRYLHRLGHVSDNRCRCGAVESPEHLLLACSLYKEQRKLLFKDLSYQRRGDNKTEIVLLFSTKVSEKLLVFLKETSISTRSWHTERIVEEEESDSLAESEE